MNANTLPLKDVFRDLTCMSSSLSQLLNKGKEYDVIIKYLIEKDFGDDHPIPHLKEIVTEIGIPYAKFRKRILQLYEDVRLSEDFVFESPSVRYEFYYNHKGKTFTITYNDLRVVPRIGEKIYLPFFQAHIHNSYFHVKNISHYFYNDSHEVDIELGQFDYNLYWKIRLDEARLKEELTLFEQLSMSEDELKEKLGFVPHWKRNFR